MKILEFLVISLIPGLIFGLNYLPYQAHGFNDLDYFTQLLIKGVDYFKLDLSPQIRESCVQSSNWDESMNQCETFSSGFEICCLAFRGDTSSTPIFNQPFNYSMELIDLLKNPKYYHILKKGAAPPYDKPLVIAINFQYREGMSEFTKSFLYSLMNSIENLDLNVEFITGNDDFIYGYMDKCQVQCDEVERYIASAPIYLQSGSYNTPSRYGERRVRNFNVFYQNIQKYCDNGFPDWVTDFPYSMIFWEPSHEYQIQFTRDQFESPNCKLNEGLKDLKRFRMSSNLEPEMIQVYWKKPVFEIKNDFNPVDQKIVLYGDYHDSSVDHSELCDFLILSHNKQKTLNSKVDQSAIIRIYNNKFDLVESLDINFHIVTTRTQNEYLLIQGEAKALLFTFGKSDNEQCTIGAKEEINMRDSELLALSYNTKEIIYFDFDEDMQNIKFQFYDITTKQLNGEVSYETHQIMKTPSQSFMFDAYYSNTTKSYHIAMTFTKFGLMEGELGVTLSNQVKIYLSVLEVSTTYEVLDYVAPVHHVDFGSTSDLKLFEFDGEMYMLAIHTNGLCQSAILLNNNDWNKCIYESFAQFEAISNVENMINYFWGKLDHIKQRVETGHKINGCDLQIMHAKVGVGRAPSITLRKNGSDIQAYAVADFIPYKQQNPFTQLFCGSSNDYEGSVTNILQTIFKEEKGVMIFSFDLVHPDQLNLV